MITLDERYTLEAPKGSISQRGMSEVITFINEQKIREGEWLALNPTFTYGYLPTLPIAWQWVWVVTEKGSELVGNFPTRVRSYYFKQYGLKCPKKFIEQIGNLARQHTEESPLYRFEFVKRFNQSAGEFGDGDSCYYYDRVDAFSMLAENNAMMLRFYDADGNGMARAWVAQEDDFYIVFNGYGFAGNATLTIASVMAQFLNVSYKRIWLRNEGTDSGTLWIDSGIGYAVGAVDVIESITSHDLGWYDPGHYVCDDCGRRVSDDEIYYGADDNHYCERCFSERFDYCSICGETHYRDDITYTQDHEYACRYCLDRSYMQCEHCQEWVRTEEVVEHKEVIYCPDCAPPPKL